MLKLIVRRLLAAIPVILGVVLVAQLLVALMPGDPAAILAGDEASPETVELIRQDLGLDQPLPQRYVNYIWNALHGDLGKKPGGNFPVADRIWEAIPVTLSLMFVAMVFAIIFGTLLGTAAALRRGRFVDRAVVGIASVAQSVPPFVVALLLVVPLAVNRSWLPVTGYVSLTENPWEWLRHLALPGFALALAATAEIARQTRGALVDALEQDYVRASRVKGLPERRVIGKHAAKNAATPVLTVAGLQVARLIGGTVVVESIFVMNGLGTLAVNAVTSRDYVMIQGVVLVTALGVLFVNLVVDVAYGYLNPRVRP